MIKYEDDNLTAEGDLKSITEEWYYLTYILVENIAKEGNMSEQLVLEGFIDLLERTDFETQEEGEN